MVTVNATNTAAHFLYQSKGFTCFGLEPEECASMDDIIMERSMFSVLTKSPNQIR
jgi:hypothetical protein